MRFAAALGRDLRQTVGFPRGLAGAAMAANGGSAGGLGAAGPGFFGFDGSSQIRGSGLDCFGLEGGAGSTSGCGVRQGMAPRHEFFEGAVVGPLAGVDDALEALEDGGIGGEGVAGGAGYGGLDIFYKESVAGGEPELGFRRGACGGGAIRCDESIDEEALLGIGGTVQLMVSADNSARSSGFSSNMIWWTA